MVRVFGFGVTEEFSIGYFVPLPYNSLPCILIRVMEGTKVYDTLKLIELFIAIVHT